jgi:gliding motility-associated-like protein
MRLLLPSFFASLLTLLFCFQDLKAWHIAGAELTYVCLGNNRYEINLKMYRDCSRDGQPNVAGWDDPIYLYIFTGRTKQRYRVITVQKPPIQKVVPENAVACVFSLPSVCLEQGVYKTIVELPPLVGGYDIAWTRCCRNENVINLFQSRDRGVTFLAHIPGPEKAECNSMPVFNDRPPLFICANKEFQYDHSAKDSDSDSLVYAITNPYDSRNHAGLGASFQVPTVGPQNPMGPPDYINTPFNRGYSFFEPFGAAGLAVIEPLTGFLRLRPTQTGLFVVAISVFEYRKGVLLSENKRDMQFVVVNCKDFPAPPSISKDLTGYEHSGDTLFIDAEDRFCVPITLRDTLQNNAKLMARVIGAGLLEGVQFRTLVDNNPLKAEVCWKPGCDKVGKLIPIVVQGRNKDHCEHYNYVYDTLWVRIRPKPPVATRLKLDFAGNIREQDTVLVNLNATACVFFEIEAADPNAQIVFSAQMLNFSPGDNANIEYQHLGNRIMGKVCWKAQCAVKGDVVGVALKGSGIRDCRARGNVSDTIYFKSIPPKNPKPGIRLRLSSGELAPDTLTILVEELYCFNYQLKDSLPPSRLQIATKIIALPDTLPLSPSPEIFPPDFVSPTEITGKICYKPACPQLNTTLALAVIGYDYGPCKLDHIVTDTIFIKVREPHNPKPVLWQDIPNSINRVADTLLLRADSVLCYTFILRDSLPKSRHQFKVVAQELNTLEDAYRKPQLTIVSNQNDTLIQGKICWKAECKFLDKVVRLILTAEDYNTCRLNYTLAETLYVKIWQPENPKPEIETYLPDNLVWRGDTIFLTADSVLCWEVVLKDKPPASKLFVGAKVETLSGTPLEYQYLPSHIILPESKDTVLRMASCWKAPCAWLGETIKITPWGLDSAVCTLSWLVPAPPIYIKIVERKLQPISIQKIFDPYPNRNDTVTFWVKRKNCIQIVLQDTLNKGDLQLSARSIIFNPSQTLGKLASLDPRQGNKTINAQFCWQPYCSALNTVIPVYLEGISNLSCALAPVFVSDTFYIKIEEPLNKLPYFEWEPSDNIEPLKMGVEHCYYLKLYDPDTFTILSAKGKSAVFFDNYGAGSNVKMDTLGINPLEIKLCFTPNCYLENTEYTLKLCGYDSSLCTKVDSACTALSVLLEDCRISFFNVFTPNSDGVNEYFLPFEMSGIEKYELYIYNRWGQLLMASDNGKWDGLFQGRPAEEGVYFYKVKFFKFNGNGKDLVGEKAGSFTLLR